MPVWHAKTRAMRASGELAVVGITQEQHPDRCRLYAQWQELDWPILWDPFNLTGSAAVPIVSGIDAHGVVRAALRNPERDAADEFFEKAYEPPASAPAAEIPVRRELLAAGSTPDTLAEWAIAKMLWEGPAAYDDGIAALEEAVGQRGEDPVLLFRLGVAHRLRYDSPAGRSGDFQASLDHWTHALRKDPNQYIWRRRIQQWGPRLDKPYAFYDWVARAREEIAARGAEPIAVAVALTGSEVADQSNVLPARKEERANPDPKREIAQDEVGLVRVAAAAALNTSAGGRNRSQPTARVYVELRPDPVRDVHWSNDAGPTLVWISVPQGWRLEQNLHELPLPGAEPSNETRRLELEVLASSAEARPIVRGFALYYVCEGESGECVYRRRDFEIELPLL